jgi:SAM-dependent methyltransferase
MSAVIDRVLEHPIVYRLWQAPFEAAKFTPLRRHNDLVQVRRVLDVGCGPGTNALGFQHADYLGCDINPRYIDYARRHFSGRFVLADATTWQPPGGERFDFVLVNSLLHHIDDLGVRQALARLRDVISEGGHLHLLELVTPERGAAARWLARADRGQFSRTVKAWVELCDQLFEPVLVEPYCLEALGVTLWNMVYYKGRPR